MMIAVFDGGFMNADKIPALHDIKLAGIRDFVQAAVQEHLF